VERITLPAQLSSGGEKIEKTISSCQNPRNFLSEQKPQFCVIMTECRERHYDTNGNAFLKSFSAKDEGCY